MPTQRQTLLFSATVPPSLLEVAEVAVQPNYKFINTIPEDEQHTHKRVPQQCLVVPFKDTLLAVFQAIYDEIKQNPSNFKIMCFLSTVGFTSYMSDLFRTLGQFPVIELHSKKSQ